MHKDDVDDVKTVLQSKGLSWEKKIAFDFQYISQSVRRKVPAADILYHHIKAVFEFFKEKKTQQLEHNYLVKKNTN